jgi:hypothetical protein
MLEEVKASISIAQSRQRKQKKRKWGRLFYSTPLELERSRIRKNKVVPCFNVDHGNTSRILDFQRSDMKNIAC